MNITVWDSNVNGTVEVKKSSSVTVTNSSIANVVARNGGAFELARSSPTSTTVNLTANCAAKTEWPGPASMCKAAPGQGVQDIGIEGLAGATKDWHPYATGSFQVYQVDLFNVTPSGLSQNYTTFGDHIPNKIVAQLALPSLLLDCLATVVGVDCGEDGGNLPWKYIYAMIAMSAVGMFVVVIVLHFRYHEWAIPDKGLLCLPKWLRPAVHWLFACTCFYGASVASDEGIAEPTCETEERHANATNDGVEVPAQVRVMCMLL
jgi:hypothetical protein